MWHDDPASAIVYFAMNVAATPFAAQISFTPFLYMRVVVGRRERVRIGDVDLVLAATEFTLRELDRDPGTEHPVADLADDHSSFVVWSMW